MFRNRAIKVTFHKDEEPTVETISDPETFERNAETILRKIESLGAKMFMGVCIYVVLDTRRQVKIERAKNPR